MTPGLVIDTNLLLLHQLYAIKPENVIPFESLRIASGKRRL